MHDHIDIQVHPVSVLCSMQIFSIKVKEERRNHHASLSYDGSGD